MPEITVIVPVYKVEQYLSECVDSILAQTFKDFELILIDDGSPDNCGKICDEYAKQDERIIVIHQENQGLSGARNAGMDIARGEYITFVDSDDVVTNDYLEKLLYILKKEDADISICQMYEFKEENILISNLGKNENLEYEIYNNKKACEQCYYGNRKVSVNACAKLFRRILLNEIRFPVGKLHEDQAFVPLVYYKAEKIVSINNKMYYYRLRSGSIMHDIFSIKRYDDVWAVDYCCRFFEEHSEQSIVLAAQKKKQRLMCVYSIYARRDNVKIPKEYKVSTLKALMYLKKNVSEERFEYYLGQVNMNLVYLYEYLKKIKKILKVYS